MLRCLAFGFLFIATQVIADGLIYLNTTNGYRIDIQPGWVQVPDSVLVEKKKLMSLEGQKLGLDTAFQMGHSGEWMAYPYVTVQPVGRLTPGRSMTEREFNELITRLRDVKNLPKMQERIATMSRPDDAEMLNLLVGNLNRNSIFVDGSKKKFWLTAPFPRDKELILITGGTVLSNGMLVQLNGYCEKDDLKAFVSAYMKMLDSVRDI